jgi:hypothetical protein
MPSRICASMLPERGVLVMLGVLALPAVAACGHASARGGKSIEPVYDSKTGRLQLLKYDSNGNGVVDTWSYMDGARVLRIEIDTNEDGTIDRWEHYDANQKLEKVGFSREHDGHEDAWTYANPDGSVARIEYASHANGRIDRREFFEHDTLVRAEEDSDGDGRTDKWESYEDGRLSSVAFDTTHDGQPDRRLVYGADGSARLEVAAADGRFVPAR